jgi:GNAT superfamily N-acetyltransferase
MSAPIKGPVEDPSLILQSYTRGDYTISTDPTRLDADAIFGYLSRSYWASARPREVLDLSLLHSLNFGLYYAGAEMQAGAMKGEREEQVGLARIVTDYATFAYLCDVYILEEHRGDGLGKWLIETAINDPTLKNINRFMLATRDAHGLYAQFGFAPFAKPEIWMERLRIQP